MDEESDTPELRLSLDSIRGGSVARSWDRRYVIGIVVLDRQSQSNVASNIAWIPKHRPGISDDEKGKKKHHGQESNLRPPNR